MNLRLKEKILMKKLQAEKKKKEKEKKKKRKKIKETQSKILNLVAIIVTVAIMIVLKVVEEAQVKGNQFLPLKYHHSVQIQMQHLNQLQKHQHYQKKRLIFQV